MREQQLQAELDALRDEMQALTATVSHDLRAPLRHILAYTELVREDAAPVLSAEVLGFLATISASAQHLAAMLDGLLDLSRLGTVAVHSAPVDLQILLPQLCAELEVPANAPAVDWRIGSDLPWVWADAGLLGPALVQVLRNALQFSAPRAQPVITISACTDGPGLQIHDNGVGFNPQRQEQLFRPFSRLHSAQKFPGLGMGLALARKSINRQQGTITIAGLVEGGCTVSVRLPALPPGVPLPPE